MDKMIVTVFDSERQAFEGSQVLKDLHADGTITLYAEAVIAKDADGTVAVKRAADQGPLGTAVGLVTGSLVGLLGGLCGGDVQQRRVAPVRDGERRWARQRDHARCHPAGGDVALLRGGRRHVRVRGR